MLLDRWDDLTTEDELSGFLDVILAFRAGETACEYEAEEKKYDGSPVQAHTRAMVLADLDDDWSRVVISTMDISARKTAETALVESEALMREIGRAHV